MTELERPANRLRSLLALGFFAALLVFPVAPYAVLPQATLTRLTLASPQPQPLGEFGTSAAAAGGLVVVGASLETVSGHSTAGRVYVFSPTGRLLRTLASPNPETGGEFGSSVAIGSGIIVVSAPLETVRGIPGAGRVYVFSSSSGALVNTLTSPRAETSGVFGSSIAAYGVIVVVGALGESVGRLVDSGRAYTFNAVTGVMLNSLTSPNAQNAGGFGVSVAVTKSLIVVGAWSETVNGIIVAGRAYAFSILTGGLISTMVSPNPQTAGEFGFSVAANGVVVVVGAWSESVRNTPVAGHVYIFNGQTATPTRTLQAPSPRFNAQFGFSVAMNGDTLLVGARGDTIAGSSGTGAAYFFVATTGALVKAVTSPNAQAEGEFGFCVATSGPVSVVGALLETANGFPSAGHAYVYSGS